MPTPGLVTVRRVGLIGVGVMGEPIARNLLAAGFHLTLFNRSDERLAPLRDRAVIAATARDVVEGTEAVILTVPGEQEIDEVLGRSGGVLRSPIHSKIVINMATVSPSYSEALAAAVTAGGGSYVEAPLSGSRKPAEAGTLIVLAAADKDSVLDRVQPIFGAIGKRTIRCGVPPSAMRMKLANNLLLITLLEGIAEAMHFARGIGLDLERFADLVLSGPMANDIYRGKARKLVERDFSREAPIKHVHKDIRLVCEEATRAGLHAPVAATNAGLLAAAVEDGLSDEDIVAVVRILERRSERVARPFT